MSTPSFLPVINEASHFPPACPEMHILTAHVLTSLRSILEVIQVMADGPIALNSKRC